MGFFNRIKTSIGKVKDTYTAGIGKLKEWQRHRIGQLQKVHRQIGTAAETAHEAIRNVPFVGKDAYDYVNKQFKDKSSHMSQARDHYRKFGRQIRDYDNRLYEGHPRSQQVG